MTKIEHLLICLTEEGAEVALEGCKAIRFGLGNTQPGQLDDHKRRVEREIADILGVARELGLEIREEDIEAKRVKLRKMMALSVELGTLESERGERA